MADLNLNVSESLNVGEALDNNPTALYFTVNDVVLVFDYGDIWSFIQVAEDINALEIANVFQPELAIDVSEAITVVEVWVLPIEINIFEQFFVTEFVDRVNGLLFFNVYDEATIADYSGAVVVLYFIVHDIAVNTEYVELILGRAVFGFTNVSLNEFVNIAKEVLDNLVWEDVSVIEYAILGREVEMLDAYTDITVLEVALAEITLDLSFNDFLRSYPFDEETLTNIIVEQFENGAEQRRDKWGRTRKRFGVNFSPRSKDEIDALRTFYVQRRGPANAFNFESPLDGAEYVVRFEENSLQISRTAYGIYNARVTLVEVF